MNKLVRSHSREDAIGVTSVLCVRQMKKNMPPLRGSWAIAPRYLYKYAAPPELGTVKPEVSRNLVEIGDIRGVACQEAKSRTDSGYGDSDVLESGPRR